MSFNIQRIQESNTGGSPVAALYPPNKLEGDKSTIIGLLEGIGIESFTYEPAGYAKLTVYKEIPDTDNKRGYSAIIGDFFTSEQRININGKFLLDAFQAVEPTADLSKFPADLSSLEDVVNAFNKVFSLPSPMNPNAVAKIVFRNEEGEKSQYNLSKNFPSVGLKSNTSIKFKTNGKESKYDDLVVFNKVAASTDDALGMPSSAGLGSASIDYSAASDNL